MTASHTEKPAPLGVEELRALWRADRSPNVRRLLLEVVRLRDVVLRAQRGLEMFDECFPPGKYRNVTQRVIGRLLEELAQEPVVQEDRWPRKYANNKGLFSSREKGPGK